MLVIDILVCPGDVISACDATRIRPPTTTYLHLYYYYYGKCMNN